MEGMRPWSAAAVAVLAFVPYAPPGHAATTRACSDPCLQSARAELKDCAGSAGGAFQTALDGCLEREHECVDSCRWERQECRDDTSLGSELAACQVALDAAKAECEQILGPIARLRCIYRAQVQGFRCRRQAFRGARRELRGCEAAFKQCANACGAGQPPEGVKACRQQAKAALQSHLADCRQIYQVTASACIDKDLDCTQSCVDARETCTAPTQATLDAALQSCTTQELAAVQACIAANPGGGSALEDCITATQANAFTCREDAIQDAGPGFAACVGPYVSCVRSCPAAPTTTASVIAAPAGSRCTVGGR
jgi:hypothetical protein